VALASAASSIFYTSKWILAACAIAWLGSLWWYGRRFEER